MFKEKTQEEIDKMTPQEVDVYKAEKAKHDTSLRKQEIDEAIKEALKSQASKEEIETLTKKQTEVIKEIEEIGLAMKLLNENKSVGNEGLKKYIQENSEVLKNIKANKSNAAMLDITLKGSEVATDITGRDDYAMIMPGTIRKPVRKTRILDLFKRKKVSTEYIKYREENVVTRDAKFVVACATSTHTTKKSWIMRTVELAKIRDIIDICIDMLDDYDFVESEMRELIEESVKLKADYELLLGASATATDMLSIDSIASEFDPANVLAPFTASFQDANLEQLVDAMAAQISVFGQENSWMADTVLMNFTDFVKYRNLKDDNGNKLNHTLSDNVATIAGMRVVTSPIVTANTLYVFDSTRGFILDRQMLTIKTSFENRDNIEHETVTLVAVERLQFHVALIDRDAFMKSSDVTAAIAAIDEAVAP